MTRRPTTRDMMKLALRIDCDVRSIRRFLDGRRRLRGNLDYRIARGLRQAGFGALVDDREARLAALEAGPAAAG